MTNPRDSSLYKRVRRTVFRKYPVHSAYRSGRLVKDYKRTFRAKHGTRKSPYIGRVNKTKGLKRWFKEKWRNQRGTVGYRHKSDVYRPTRRITKRTPLTFKELSRKRLRRARHTKRRKGRVRRF